MLNLVTGNQHFLLWPYNFLIQAEAGLQRTYINWPMGVTVQLLCSSGFSCWKPKATFWMHLCCSHREVIMAMIAAPAWLRDWFMHTSGFIRGFRGSTINHPGGGPVEILTDNIFFLWVPPIGIIFFYEGSPNFIYFFFNFHCPPPPQMINGRPLRPNLISWFLDVK